MGFTAFCPSYRLLPLTIYRVGGLGASERVGRDQGAVAEAVNAAYAV